MNLIDAIKSGRRYRRKNTLYWMSRDGHPSYTADLVVADDWELEPLPAPKLKAWLVPYHWMRLEGGESTTRSVHYSEMGQPEWERAPWLDEP